MSSPAALPACLRRNLRNPFRTGGAFADRSAHADTRPDVRQQQVLACGDDPMASISIAHRRGRGLDPLSLHRTCLKLAKDDSAVVLAHQSITALNPADRHVHGEYLTCGRATTSSGPNTTGRDQDEDGRRVAVRDDSESPAETPQGFFGFDQLAPLNARVHPDGAGSIPARPDRAAITTRNGFRSRLRVPGRVARLARIHHGSVDETGSTASARRTTAGRGCCSSTSRPGSSSTRRRTARSTSAWT